MNYRHAFHAGGFADVFKHAILARVLVHLRGKTTPFRVIDIHAGAGLYDLASEEAGRTGEWRDGIGRLFDAALPAEAGALLAPYLAAVRSCIPDGALRHYPGSPLLVCALLRPQDRLIACELEPATAAALAHRLRAIRQAKVIAIDGRMALGAYVPPNERRGLVILDPPYEQPTTLPVCLPASPRRCANGRPGSTWRGTRSRAAKDRTRSPGRCAAAASKRRCASK
jgi:23S rRNA (adenine2030-N6)-methyltransferase